MVKDEVISEVFRKTMYNRSIVENVMDAILDTITESLKNGESVQFSGFGTFEPKQRNPRIGRNPRTNEEVAIPARIVPYFKAGKSLKKAVIKPINVDSEE